MSVLIKGMEKPKSCIWWDGKCPLLGDDDDCKLQDCQEEWTWQDQYKGCPLSDAPDKNVDTISRQDVLALAKDVTLQNGCKHRCIDATMIHELPPAQLGTMAVRGYPIDADYLMAKVAEEYGERARDALYRIIRYMPSAQPEYYDYSDIDPLWKSFAEENDINLTETAKQLKDAMWCGYRKGKADAQPDWNEMIVICDCCGHAIHVKRIDAERREG